jgi:hypothetical protein
MLMVEIIHPQLGLDLGEMSSMIENVESDYVRLRKLFYLMQLRVLEVYKLFMPVRIVRDSGDLYFADCEQCRRATQSATWWG